QHPARRAVMLDEVEDAPRVAQSRLKPEAVLLVGGRPRVSRVAPGRRVRLPLVKEIPVGGLSPPQGDGAAVFGPFGKELQGEAGRAEAVAQGGSAGRHLPEAFPIDEERFQRFRQGAGANPAALAQVYGGSGIR